MAVSVFKRNETEIKNDPRIIRLGKVHRVKDLDYSPDYSKVNKILIESLINSSKNNIINEEREVIATKCMIYALISSIEGHKVNISYSVEEKYYNKEWMIS